MKLNELVFFDFLLKGRNDAVVRIDQEGGVTVVVESVHVGFGFGAFGEPAFDSGAGFGICFTRMVPDCFLELTVLSLLSVTENPRFSIHAAELCHLIGGSRHRRGG